MYELLEEIISEHFGIKKEALVGNSRQRPYSDGRHFLYYILYYIFGYKVSAIADRYGRTRRNIYDSIDLIHDSIRLQPYYRDTYRQLMDEIRDKVVI